MPFTRTNGRRRDPQRPTLWQRIRAWLRNLFR